MQTSDTPNGYGWISIALHWATAAVVLTLWFIGNTIETVTGEAYEHTLRLHTSVAVTFYVLLWARIIWRFTVGHPGPLKKQAGPFFTLGKYVHLSMLVAIGVNLVTGPLMVWSTGTGIYVFDWFVIPTPLEPNMDFHDLLFKIHSTSALVIIVTTVLHIGGVYKHAAFNQDGTFTKMLIPGREDRP